MEKYSLFFLLHVFVIFSGISQEIKHNGPSVDFSNGRLKVTSNGRFLEHENGVPFFYIGETAWELFHRLTLEEAEIYLENRREKGFTVIQAVALAELDGLNTPNVYGERPLINNDPEKPNLKYWEHVDRIIQTAEEKGLFIGLLPTWGDKVDLRWGTGPVIFNEQNAYQYGKWIGNRYKDQKNIIWINGGDRDCGGKNKPVWDALAHGIKETDKNHLMTFHPWGGSSSSRCFQNSGWLDFNMLQSGHWERYIDNYAMVNADYALIPVKPCMDGEPNYEDHPVRMSAKYGWFDDEDVRRASYWSVFAGGIGVTYGAHPVWQMKHIQHDPISEARHNWDEVLDLPGAWDMIHLRRLMESRPFITSAPDQSVILHNNDNINRMVAVKGDGFIMIYLTSQRNIEFRAQTLQAESLWYGGTIPEPVNRPENRSSTEIPGTCWMFRSREWIGF